MDHTEQSPVILSLCTGMRGLERGLERAIGEIQVAAYVEIEAFAIWNMVKQMEEGILAPVPVWTDLKTFPAQEFHGKVHGIIGGYPCQPFSNAGERRGEDDPRHLFPHICRIIQAARPVFCFFENVEGHLTLGYDSVYKSLRSMGYAVESGIYSAEEVGAPHRRNRLFILAVEHSAKQGLQEPGQSWFRQLCEKARKRMDDRLEQPGIELANSDSIRCEYEQEGYEQTQGNEIGQFQTIEQAGNDKQRGFIQSSEELAQPDSERHIHWKPEQQPTDAGEHAQRNIATGCGNVADTDSRGSEQDRQQTQVRAASTIEPPGDSGIAAERQNNQRGCDRWPARPGEAQYEWEEPRVESSLGFTINGHNFREDLLRLAGNGVVEQTAEIAFIDLLNKHMNG